MKIAITHFNLATESGDTRMLYTKARALAAMGHSVDIYTVLFDESCYPNLHKGLNIIVIPLSRGNNVHISGADGIWKMIIQRIKYLRFSARAADAIKKKLRNGYDIVDFQDDASYHVALSYRKSNKNTKIIWTMNTCPYHRTKKSSFIVNILSIVIAWWEKMKVRWYVREIDLVIVNAEEQKEFIEEVVSPERVFLLRIPVDFESFFSPPRKIKSTVVLLDVGSLSQTRKFEDIIMAAAILKREGYKTMVNLICRDSSKNKTYKDFLLRLTEKERMKENVNFYFEGANEQELRRIQKTSHIFVFPNCIRIWGMAAFEGMAAGLVLVVSNATNIAEALEDGENAVFAKAGNPSSIADRIKYLINNPEIYEKIARNGQEFVRKNLTWDKYVEKIVS